jgi:hypothetical protein
MFTAVKNASRRCLFSTTVKWWYGRRYFGSLFASWFVAASGTSSSGSSGSGTACSPRPRNSLSYPRRVA